MPDKELKVYETLNNAQNKFVYFILTLTVGAIAFAIKQTDNAVLSLSQIPIGISVLCWGLSIFFGCFSLMYVSAALRVNGKLLFVESGRDPEVGNNPTTVMKASKILRDIFETNSNKTAFYTKLQYSLFILGTVSFITWHILEMYLKGVKK